MRQAIELRTRRREDLHKRLKDPRRIIQDARMKVDDYTERLARVFSARLVLSREKLAHRQDNLVRVSPQQQLLYFKEKLEQLNTNLKIYKDNIFKEKSSLYREAAARLKTLDPSATLRRGYSITRIRKNRQIVIDPDRVADGQMLDISVARGTFGARVDKEKKNGQEDL